MSTGPPVTVTGVINPDGSLQFAQPHGLPPGPVRVSLEQIGKPSDAESISGLPQVKMPLPDPPILDTAISAPCDLPLTGPSKRIYPRKLDKMPLPDPHDIDESME